MGKGTGEKEVNGNGKQSSVEERNEVNGRRGSTVCERKAVQEFSVFASRGCVCVTDELLSSGMESAPLFC